VQCNEPRSTAIQRVGDAIVSLHAHDAERPRNGTLSLGWFPIASQTRQFILPVRMKFLLRCVMAIVANVVKLVMLTVSTALHAVLTLIFIATVVVVALFFIYRQDKIAEMRDTRFIADFQSNRQAFTALVECARKTPFGYYVRLDGSVPISIGISDQAARELIPLMQAAHVVTLLSSDGEIYLTTCLDGIHFKWAEKGYAYLPTPPKTVLTSLENHHEFAKLSKHYRPIEGPWYLFLSFDR
jgi:hypothetical protein